MTNEINAEAQRADDFDDELGDEALDRQAETPSCVVFSRRGAMTA